MDATFVAGNSVEEGSGWGWFKLICVGVMLCVGVSILSTILSTLADGVSVVFCLMDLLAFIGCFFDIGEGQHAS